MPTSVRSALPALLLALAATGAGVHQAEGQDVRVRAEPTERGWIGVSFQMTSQGGEPVEAIRITDVSDGSPAASAGLRPGDRLIAINDLRTPRELAALPELLRLRAGDEVTMMIERDGVWRRVRLRAAPRPDGFATGRSVEVSLRADSMVETWARSMDSLRVRLRAGDRSERVLLRRAGGNPGEGGTTVTRGRSDRGVRAPFEFFVFRGEAHDSLRHEMVEINAMVGQLQARIRERERELRRRLGDAAERERSRDAELRRLEAELERASARSGALEAAMAEDAQETAGMEYGVVRPGAAEAPMAGGEFRPLTPYLLGRNRVAGAQVVDLNPQLARYFDVTSGVLVVEVAPGTPAAAAGIVAGDVITRIDQVGVRSVEDLRFGVSVAEDSLPITLIREGASRQVLLRK